MNNRLVGAVAAGALCIGMFATPAGADTTTWGEFGTGPGQLSQPIDLAVAPNGDLCVVNFDETTPRVQRFTGDGAYIGQIGESGAQPGQYGRPRYVAVAPNGVVYVGGDRATAGSSAIQRFSAQGAFEGEWLASAPPNHVQTDEFGPLAVGPGGEVYALNRPNRLVEKFDANGGFLASIGEPGNGPGQLGRPGDIATDAAGNLYVLVEPEQFPPSSPMRVEKFSPSGQFLAEWPVQIPGNSQQIFASAMKIGPGGNVYIASGDRRLMRFSPTGEFISALALPTLPGTTFYAGLALNDDFLYTADNGNAKVLRINLRKPSPSLAAPEQVLTGASVTLDAGASSVPLGQIVDYRWDLDGNGSFETSTGGNPLLTTSFGARGSVQLGLSVTSDLGGTATSSHLLRVLPAPPPGPVGVSIDGGAQFTNDPSVDVTVRWPSFASDLMISNDGGFAPFKQLRVDPKIRWRLRSSGPERLPKTIYVRFLGGSSGPETYQDDIILDQTAPKLGAVTIDDVEAMARIGSGQSSRLHVVAKDKVSGVGQMQVTAKKAKPGKWRRFRANLVVNGAHSRLFVRVRDQAGNASRWKRAVH